LRAIVAFAASNFSRMLLCTAPRGAAVIDHVTDTALSWR
jgi:hypothetical protein